MHHGSTGTGVHGRAGKELAAWATADAVPSRCSEPDTAEVRAGATCGLRALPPSPTEPPLPGPGPWGIPIGCQNVPAER